MAIYRVKGSIGRRKSSLESVDHKGVLDRKVEASLPKVLKGRVLRDSAQNPNEPPGSVLPPLKDEPKKDKTSAATSDGEVKLFEFRDIVLEKRKKFVDDLASVDNKMDHARRAIFINGMNNSGEDNKNSACILSFVQMCPVISVYNKSGGGFTDFGQCITDKVSMQVLPLSPKKAFEKIAKGRGTKKRIRLMERILSEGALGNSAAGAMFRVLADGQGQCKNIPIFAHSQGNLILSNALQGVKIALGPDAIKGRNVFSYGSPAVSWPGEIEHFDHAFTFDLVSMLNIIPSLSISKVGMPDDTSNPFTHDFLWYLKEDAAFIINRHRVGGLGATFHMDEESLAKELVSFGGNQERLLRVFSRLDSEHNSDVDDVALAYVRQIQKDGRVGTLKAMTQLVKKLIRYMTEGVTFSDEEGAIEFLKLL